MPPPPRSTLANSRAAAVLSGKVQNAHSQMTASKEASGNGSRSASPLRKLTRFIQASCRSRRVRLLDIMAPAMHSDTKAVRKKESARGRTGGNVQYARLRVKTEEFP